MTSTLLGASCNAQNKQKNVLLFKSTLLPCQHILKVRHENKEIPLLTKEMVAQRHIVLNDALCDETSQQSPIIEKITELSSTTRENAAIKRKLKMTKLTINESDGTLDSSLSGSESDIGRNDIS